MSFETIWRGETENSGKNVDVGWTAQILQLCFKQAHGKYHPLKIRILDKQETLCSR